MSITCEIVFEANPNKVVYTGQLFHGTVNFKLSKEQNVLGIFMKIMSKAYAYWQEGPSDNRRTYGGKEKYYNDQMYLVGGSGDKREIRLAPGEHSYPFQHVLPKDLPTSFEGKFGYIRYTTCVTVDISMQPNKEFETPFTVIQAIDLNADPTLREPVVVKGEKRFYPCFLLWCIKSNPLEIIARTPVGGYVPGQTINLRMSVTNKSGQKITRFIAQLVKYSTYYDSNNAHFAVQTVVLNEVQTHGCGVNQEDVICVNLDVPSVPPSDETTSNIIKVKYYCRIIGAVDCWHRNAMVLLPLKMGTYPIRDGPEKPKNGAIDSSNPFSLALPDQTGRSPSPSHVSFWFPDDEPPVYEDALEFGKSAKKEFIPKYPMFKRETSYSRHDKC